MEKITRKYRGTHACCRAQAPAPTASTLSSHAMCSIGPRYRSKRGVVSRTLTGSLMCVGRHPPAQLRPGAQPNPQGDEPTYHAAVPGYGRTTAISCQKVERNARGTYPRSPWLVDYSTAATWATVTAEQWNCEQPRAVRPQTVLPQMWWTTAEGSCWQAEGTGTASQSGIGCRDRSDWTQWMTPRTKRPQHAYKEKLQCYT